MKYRTCIGCMVAAALIVPAIQAQEAVIADEEFASEVEQMFVADFAKARLMEPGEADDKPWWFRFAVRLARLTAPVQ